MVDKYNSSYSEEYTEHNVYFSQLNGLGDILKVIPKDSVELYIKIFEIKTACGYKPEELVNITINLDDDEFNLYAKYINTNLTGTLENCGIRFKHNQTFLGKFKGDINIIYKFDMSEYRNMLVNDLLVAILNKLNIIHNVYIVFADTVNEDDKLLFELNNLINSKKYDIQLVNSVVNESSIAAEKESYANELNSFLQEYSCGNRDIDVTDMIMAVLNTYNENTEIPNISIRQYNELYNNIYSKIENRILFYTCYFDLDKIVQHYSDTVIQNIEDKKEYIKRFKILIAKLYSSVLVPLAYYNHLKIFIPSAKACGVHDFESMYKQCVTELVSNDRKIGESRLELASNFFNYAMIDSYEPTIIKPSTIQDKDGAKIYNWKINLTGTFIPIEHVLDCKEAIEYESILNVDNINIIKYNKSILNSTSIDLSKECLHVIPFFRDNDCYQLNKDGMAKYEGFVTELLDECLEALPPNKWKRLTLKDFAFVKYREAIYVVIIEDIQYDLNFVPIDKTVQYKRSCMIGSAIINNGQVTAEVMDYLKILPNLLRLRAKSANNYSPNVYMKVPLESVIPLNFTPDYEKFLFSLYIETFSSELYNIKKEILKSSVDSGEVPANIILNSVNEELREYYAEFHSNGLTEAQFLYVRKYLTAPPKNSLKYLLYYRMFKRNVMITEYDDYDEFNDYLTYMFFTDFQYNVDGSDNSNAREVVKLLDLDMNTFLRSDIYGKPTIEPSKACLHELKRGGDKECCKRMN